MVGAVVAFSVFSMRATVLASWGHRDNPDIYKGDVAVRDYGEVPRELLVYTQTSGDIPVLVKEIEKAAAQLDDPKSIPIVIDSSDGFTWPWAWYLRDSKFKNVTYTSIEPGYTPPPGAIIFASTAGATNLQQLGESYNEGIPYHHRRWFPEEYRGVDGAYSTQDFFGDLFTPSVLFDNWMNYWVTREPPAEIGQVDGVAFFPREFDVSPPPVQETVRQEGTHLIVGRHGWRARANSALPRTSSIDGDGNLWVADTNNHRISKYDSAGKYVSGLAGFGSDVSMKEPWSLTIADDGTIFVADTWNHKVVKFDADGNKVAEWGVGGQTDSDGDGQVEDDDPFKLYAPREIALAPDGNVLITDTGNNRVVEYTADGEFVRQFGKKGTSGAPTDFSEPVGLVVADNGDIYVGDFWNKRIVVLGNDLSLKREIAVDEWGSQAVTERGYMTLLDDGRLLVTDPTNARIITYGADGTRLGTFDVPKLAEATTARPIGISSDGTDVLISDSSGNVIRRMPLSEVAK